MQSRRGGWVHAHAIDAVFIAEPVRESGLLQSIDDDQYAAAKAAFLARLDEAVGAVNVVFAAGKTGTTAIASGLKRAGVQPVFQVHNLGRRLSARREAEFRRRAPGVHPTHIWEAEWLTARGPTVDRRWKIVTSVRDPIAQIVAVWFQESARFGFELDDPDRIVDDLTPRWSRIDHDWFEFQLHRLIGIDVYEHAFDPAVGYGTIATAATDVLLLRRESLDVAARPLARLFQLPADVDVRPENVGASKDYALLYQEVLARIRVPPAVADRAYSTRLARHFYSPDELRQFRDRWTA